LFHADRGTDRKKLIVALLSYTKAAKKKKNWGHARQNSPNWNNVRHPLRYENFKIIPGKISDLGRMKWVEKLLHNVGKSVVSTLHRVSLKSRLRYLGTLIREAIKIFE
jgi:hypothetical protein